MYARAAADGAVVKGHGYTAAARIVIDGIRILIPQSVKSRQSFAFYRFFDLLYHLFADLINCHRFILKSRHTHGSKGPHAVFFTDEITVMRVAVHHHTGRAGAARYADKLSVRRFAVFKLLQT